MTRIQDENEKSGDSSWRITTPPTMRNDSWRIAGVEGYASVTSVNAGGQIDFYISADDATSVNVKIFRMGYYNGDGARLMTTIPGITVTQQPFPTTDPTTGLIECTWTNPTTLNVPKDWISGIYLAKLDDGNGHQSYIIFVVRNDEYKSQYLFQSSATTDQCYNQWGGKSAYRPQYLEAVNLSFNRPYSHEAALGESVADAGAGQFFRFEYNMVRWLEKNGYDVSYCTNIDVHENPTLLLTHRAFFSVGHDEYWSREMRVNVELARDQGVHLGFFSANTCYWQIRLEPSTSGIANRTIVAYKDHLDPYQDNSPYPYPATTTLFNKIGWPEKSLLGTSYATDCLTFVPLTVTQPSHWIFANTNVQPISQTQAKVIGYEYGADLNDEITDRATRSRRVRPQGLQVIADSIVKAASHADTTIYIAQSGALVFSTGTIQWSWGLDDFTFDANENGWRLFDSVIDQMTKNVLAQFVVSDVGTLSLYLDVFGKHGQVFSTDQQASTWRDIIPGRFTAIHRDQFFCYDSSQGKGCVLSISEGGLDTELEVEVEQTWRNVVAVEFSDNVSTTGLFCYDPFAGKGQCYVFRDGQRLKRGSELTLDKYWRIMVSGDFLGTGHTDLMFYNPYNGNFAMYSGVGDGNFSLAQQNNVGANWKIVVPIEDTSGTLILFYNPVGKVADFTQPVDYQSVTNGLVRLYQVNPRGQLVQAYSDWSTRATWRAIASGSIGIHRARTYDEYIPGILFYDPYTDDGMFYMKDGQPIDLDRAGDSQLKSELCSTLDWNTVVPAGNQINFEPNKTKRGWLFYRQNGSTPTA